MGIINKLFLELWVHLRYKKRGIFMQYDQSTRKPFELDYGTDDRLVFNFFNTVYAWMACGLAVTATVAWLVAQNVSLVVSLNQRGVIVAIFLGLALLAWGIRSAALNISATVATILFMLYAAILGAALSYIFLIYDLKIIGGAFVMTAGTFGIMSVYGFVTKRDLTSMGSILMMCVVGLFLASLVNIFLANNALSWVITYAVLAVFIGLTAYDTQMLKNLAYQTQGNTDLAHRFAIIGSLCLYVDFINLFMSILRILGSRK